MFNWLFKRRGSADAHTTPTTSSPAKASTKASTPAGAAKSAGGPAVVQRGGKARSGTAAASAPGAAAARPAPQPTVDWPALLQAAQGDDTALLALAQQGSAPLEIKLAAVQALAGEEALKQAERAFRSHDRKVHQLARKRLDAAVAQREARTSARALLERAAALLGQDDMAINHVVTLDRAWQALPADRLEPEQAGRYTELRAQLDQHIRGRTEARQQEQRWLSEVQRELVVSLAALRAAAEQGTPADVAALRQTLQALTETRPDTPASAAPAKALAQALRCCDAVQARLEWLDANPAESSRAAAPPPPDASGAGDTPVELAAAATGDAPPAPNGAAAGDTPQAATSAVAGDAPPAPDSAAADDTPAALHAAGAGNMPPVPLVSLPWKQLEPVPDAALARLLDQRHDALRQAQRPAAVEAPVLALPTRAAKVPRAPQVEALSAEQLGQVGALVQQAQAVLEAGQLGELRQHLAGIDAVLGTTPLSTLPEALRAELVTLRGEGARLKGWQQWGGGRARDELTEEAEALARTTQAADDPEQPDAPKVDVKDQRERIQALRTRWKELDRLGAPASQTLWQRFDAALQIASGPVAAHHAVLMAQRRENLAAREALLATLEALPLVAQPEVSVGAEAEADAPVLLPDSPNIEGANAGADGPRPDLPQPDGSPDRAPDWRIVLRELGNFQAAWRKLGPVEHTVPADARNALQRRHRAAVDRLETPLDAARRQAAAQREQLIQHALALVPAGAHQRPVPDSLRHVRELQAHWQEHARSLPLSRPVENELWTRFKAATDAVFAHRDAAFAARDAELAGNLGACEALIERLAALGTDHSPGEVERTLTEVDRAWRQTGELPRQAADAVERRFRAAHGAAVDLLHGHERRHWQAQCDTLAARLALCEARESGHDTSDAGSGVDAVAADPVEAGSTAATLDQRWTTLAELPSPWRQALAKRWDQVTQPGPLAPAGVDRLLLQVEAALDVPTASQWEAERRQLKLRALKDAMEGRRSDTGQPADALLGLLRQAGLDTSQRARLHALVAALRQAPPGAIGTPTPRN